ncbi:helix-turn-helix domain-containing protein [Halobacteriaceae archaeon GCM10025711]
MSLIAEVTVSSDGLALSSALAEVPEMTAALEHEIGLHPSKPLLFFWAWGGDFSAFDDALDSDPTVSEVTALDEFADRRLYRVRLTRATQVVLYPKYVDLGLAMLGAVGDAESWTGRIRFPDREALSSFRTFCVENDLGFELERVYSGSAADEGGSTLTENQRETLQVAVEAGYFEIPRDTSLTGVAEALSVSPQAASERLRRAMSALATNAVEADVTD